MNMRKLFAGLVLAGLLAAAAPAAFPQDVVESIVAIVNDDIITLSEYRGQFELATNQLRAQQLPQEQFDQQYAMLKKEFLNSLITDMLLLQKAKELSLNVQEQLKGMIAKIKEDNNLASDADLRRAIEQQGMSYEAWLRQYEEGMMRQGVIYTEVERSIVLEDSEIVQYYKKNPAEFTTPTEYKLEAVYVTSEGRSAEQVEALKAAVDAKLKSGASLADTAAELSDPPMKEAKGELGSFKAGELETALESPVERLKPGERTPWINNKNAWYLLQLVEKKDSFLRPFEDARKEVEERIFGEKRAVKIQAYVKSLREKSFVKILEPDPLGLNK
ncbi:MAG TPA: SurA N-terminal domain-containing protein [Acidobacteriota bacterium]|nr:SurA N-terminal domain-containing protein [Acidobacteriota bacterium]